MNEKSEGSLPGSHLVSVFEAVNEARREAFVGTTGLLSEQIGPAFLAALPPALAHWRPEDAVRFRCVTYSIPARDAGAFAARHAAGEAFKGWKVVQGGAIL